MVVVATERAISYLDVYGTTCGAIMFVVATERAISYSLGRQYGRVLSPSFLEQYVMPLCLQWSLKEPFLAAWAGSTVQCLLYLTYISMVQHVVPSCL
jgi:hypothetical protein